MKYERITMREFAGVTGDKIYNLLAEIENKIEAGTLVEVTRGEGVFIPKERAEEMRIRNEERKQAVKEFADEFKRRYFFMMTTYMKNPIYQCTEEEFDRLVKEISEKYGVSVEDKK